MTIFRGRPQQTQRCPMVTHRASHHSRPSSPPKSIKSGELWIMRWKPYFSLTWQNKTENVAEGWRIHWERQNVPADRESRYHSCRTAIWCWASHEDAHLVQLVPAKSVDVGRMVLLVVCIGSAESCCKPHSLTTKAFDRSKWLVFSADRTNRWWNLTQRTYHPLLLSSPAGVTPWTKTFHCRKITKLRI
jgi:hypothetical protein